MKKTTIPIKGMHCRSCELIIDEKLKELPGVKQVEVNFKQKKAIVHSTGEIDQNEVRQKIIEFGYDVGIDRPISWINKDPVILKDLFYAVSFFAVLILIFRMFGFKSIGVGSVSNPSNLIVVLLIGLTAGFSSCMALVGGLVLGISAKFSESHPEASTIQKFRPHIFFNIGRIISYLILGGVIGLIGKAFQLSGSTLGFFTIIIGLVMLVVGLQLTELFPKLSAFSISLPSFISKYVGVSDKKNREYSHTNSLISGALTFFLPCGFTQAMQLYAMSTGNFWSGALIMGTFALGTAPGLLGVGGLTSIVKGIFAKRFFKFAGLVVVTFALINMSNGLNLTGYSIKWSSGSTANSNDSNVKIESGTQIVNMAQLSGGYKPNNFTIKKGIPVKWVINSEDAGSCASSIYSRELKIQKLLKQGENIIEFTPQRTGKIDFSCSMGMYRGYFNVVENDGLATQAIQNNSQSNKIASSKYKDAQVIKAVYTYDKDIQPREFTVEANKPVRFEIEAKDNGLGCMGSVALPGLSDEYFQFEKDETVIFEFVPEKKGKYYITCAMGAERGIIIVK